MFNRYRKLYFEEYAAQTLTLYVFKSTIHHRECPDLEVVAKQVGIEVTQAINEDMISALPKYKMYTSYALNPFDLQGLMSEQDVSLIFKKVEEAIKRKMVKSVHYTKYAHNGLYIFTHCFSLTMQNVKDFFASLLYPITFYDTIYLNGVDRMYCFDVKTRHINEIVFTSKDFVMINQVSLQYEEIQERKKNHA